MALSSEVVYLSWFHLCYDVYEVRAIAEVTIVELELSRTYIGASARNGRDLGNSISRSCWSS